MSTSENQLENHLKSLFEEALRAEFYGCHLFEKQDRPHYLFGPDETGDSAWLVPSEDRELVYEGRVFDDVIKGPAQRSVVPFVQSFEHHVSFDYFTLEDRIQDVENRVTKGGRDLAQTLNRYFVDVLMASVSNSQVQAQEGGLDQFLARVADDLIGRGFNADRFLFPKPLKNRLLLTVISRDDDIDNVHYAGTTNTGLKAFWSAELPDDTGLVLDSAGGVVIAQDPRYWCGKGGAFCIEVGGEVRMNLVIKNTQAVVPIAIAHGGFAGARVFIGYREEDARNHLGPLQDKLTNRFGEGQVWVAKKGMRGVKQWLDEIKRRVKWCNTMLVLIGPHWLNATDDRGQRTLDNEKDVHRQEIECALRLDKVVVPVLLEETPIPSKSVLPESLRPLLRRQAPRIRLGAEHWSNDTDKLIEDLEDELRESGAGNI